MVPSVSAFQRTPWISPLFFLPQPAPKGSPTSGPLHLLFPASPLPSPLSHFKRPFIRHLLNHTLQIITALSSPLIPPSEAFFSHPLSPPDLDLLCLFIMWSQVGSSRRMETVLFTVLPKHIEMCMVHGSNPINICFAVIEQLCFPRFLLLFRVQIYSRYSKSESGLGKLTCTFMSQACFLCLGYKGAQRTDSLLTEMPVT